MNFIKNIFTDSSGQVSSLRIILLLVFGIFVYLMYLFTQFVFYELSKEYVNYQGLASLFLAFFVSFILALFAKVIQKKYEVNSTSRRDGR